ncbi:hypothetical protein TPY_0929 [Sulfobacillus acidophilus TPY]|uniref:Uncharacterized protein n=1 Tax=Sulfobacillus acidophilus (strain ATCC 700253 / DSM 10332 / NAL) TaxID=679936 RepID=G8TXX2_SULAD|nr:hypothetical protein TPY_0929 [Sulfobacillus acidophilus TPY]AEW06178.1 hypothetical protein Sulac_2716 [Sulfobacillus acidophilus DSM 10332]
MRIRRVLGGAGLAALATGGAGGGWLAVVLMGLVGAILGGLFHG